jgi:hypothetical protein
MSDVHHPNDPASYDPGFFATLCYLPFIPLALLCSWVMGRPRPRKSRYPVGPDGKQV